MIKRFLAWLKTIYFNPDPAETQTSEVATMSEPLVDAAAEPVAAIVQPTPTPVAEVKAGVADFEAALTFVENGVAQLGEAAKEELKSLAKKYL